MYVFGKDKPFTITIKIDLSKEVGADDVFIELREPNTLEWFSIRKEFAAGEEAIAKVLKEYLPDMMVNHNFYQSESEKMDNNAVTELLFSSLTVASKVMGEFAEKVAAPFLKKKGHK